MNDNKTKQTETTETTGQTGQITQPLYDSTAPYRVVFLWKGLEIAHNLRQPTVNDLHLFEMERRDTTEVRKDEITMKSNSSRAFLYLWELLAESVEGYPFTGQNDWKEKTPALHKVSTVRVFNEVDILAENDVETQFGKEHVIHDFANEAVYISAQQTGKTILLTHVFRQPDAGNLDRWDQITAMGKMRVKKNKMVNHAGLVTKHLVDLYDSMIVETRGYADSNNIPALHKEVTIKALFRTVLDDVEEMEKN